MLEMISIGIKAAEFAKENAKPILAGSTILFFGLWSRSCIQANGLSLELEACRNAPPTIQTVTVTAKALQTVKIVYRDGSPCPDVTAENDSTFSVGVTQTAGNASGSSLPSLGPWTLGVGASHYSDRWHPAAGIGYALPRIGGYEFGVAVDASALAFSGEPGIYPQYGAKVTVRR
jgi:hypothetical protein